MLADIIKSIPISKKALLKTSILLSVGAVGNVTYNVIKNNSKKIYENADKNGGKLVANTLKAYGLKHIFTLTGGHISPILVECENNGIKVIDTRHEVTAVYAADAMARLTGKCQVAAVTSGPGLTNTVTAVKNAQLAESPLLVISGAAPIVQHNRGALQDIDHIGIMVTVCKYVNRITTIRDIVPELKKAMFIATSGIPGPVYLEMPYDILYSYDHVSKGLMPSPTRISFPFGYLSVWKRRFDLFNIFKGAWPSDETYQNPKDECYQPYKPYTPGYCPVKFKRVEKMLSKAKKPVLILGSQATLPPISPEELKEAVLKLGIPTFMSGMARGLLSDTPADQTDKNIQFRFVRKKALAEADLVIIAGLPCDFRIGFGRGINKDAKVIMINRSYETLNMNTDIFWHPTLKVRSDVGRFLYDLAHSKNVKPISLPNEFNNHLRELENQEKQKLREKVNMAMNSTVSSNKVDPLVFLYKLNEKIEMEQAKANKDIIFVVDGGDFIGTASKFIWPTKPLSWLDPGLFGTLGVGGGFAIAAKLAALEKQKETNCKDTEVWLLYGDGTAGYSIAEVDTLSRNGLQVNVCIGNDSCWTQVSRQQKPVFGGSDVACPLVDRHYEVIGEGYGGKGLLMGACHDGVSCKNEEKFDHDVEMTPEMIDKKLEEFWKLKSSNSLKPVIMNVMIDGKATEKFRQTSKYV